MTDHDAQLRQALVTAADQSAPCHRVLRHYQDRQVAVRPADFYQALKAVDEAVVRLQLEGVAPIDCRAREDGIEFATDLYDKGTATRQEFLDKVSKAAEITILPHATSAFVDTTDGYRARIENPRGFVDTIADDLRRNDHDLAERARIECDDDVVVVEADDEEAAGFLYQWLEESVTHYCEEYVDATGEYDAARQLRDVVYREFVRDDESGSEVRADGGTTSDGPGRPGGAGECPQGCHHPVAGRDTLETREETVPIEPPEVFEVYGETVVQTERVRRYQKCIVCGWVIDL
jgi:hypothetical protein